MRVSPLRTQVDPGAVRREPLRVTRGCCFPSGTRSHEQVKEMLQEWLQ
ncbi:MAG TPA: hypothetical protein VKK79_25545 [Candidatus Lokiarchaeia archaeon]|nr:hypothetical protein [Candidatus Lokiarchaeia archaeon]